MWCYLKIETSETYWKNLTDLNVFSPKIIYLCRDTLHWNCWPNWSKSLLFAISSKPIHVPIKISAGKRNEICLSNFHKRVKEGNHTEFFQCTRWHEGKEWYGCRGYWRMGAFRFFLLLKLGLIGLDSISKQSIILFTCNLLRKIVNNTALWR